MPGTVACEEHQSKDFNVQPKNISSDCQLVDTRNLRESDDRLGLARWGKRKVMEDI